MPSPIGHSLVGLALGLAAVPGGTFRRIVLGLLDRWWLVPACVVGANLPDLDFVPGLVVGDFNRFHHGPTHSLVFAIAVAVGCGWVGGRCRPGRGRVIGVAVLVLVCSHLVADIWCEDRSAPYGIPLFWPVSDAYVIAPTPVFLAMSKATLAEVFTAGNVGPALRELWVGGLAVVVALGLRVSRRG